MILASVTRLEQQYFLQAKSRFLLKIDEIV